MRHRVYEAMKVIAVFLSLIVSIANSAYGSAGRQEPAPAADVSSVSRQSDNPSLGLTLGFSMADFTGDTHPDLATVDLNGFDSNSAKYVIEIQLTEGGHQLLPLRAPFGGLIVTAKDVTGDGNLDLVVQAARSHILVAVFLNDGYGHFTAAAPSSFKIALRETTSDRKVTTRNFYVSATLVSLRSTTACFPGRSVRNPQNKSDSSCSATNEVARHRFVLFALDRAPPGIA
jgi:hypothetical protein